MDATHTMTLRFSGAPQAVLEAALGVSASHGPIAY